MTDDQQPDDNRPRSTGVTLSKRTLIVIGAVAVVVLLGLGGIIGALAMNAGKGSAPTAASPTAAAAAAAPSEEATDAPTPEEDVVSAPTPTETPTPEVLPLNTQFTVGGATMTVTGAEVLPSIPTIDGTTLAADAGQQLILVHTSYTVSGSAAVDLSCSGGDGTYIQAYDSNGNEMAPIYETSSIAGNPGCNEYLPHGSTHTWNFAYTAAAGTTPATLSVTDSNTFDTTVLAALR
ncbi:hypothetical protein [Curtobacterium sp. MCSS17_016]|uniref:hypothetical protein n=1 Tax=Curtobacterium sp. MCSS17_016 TaxID=2175644 RepID=UPI000DA7D15A|nr:hypothetical protein [Curtobacterium sp. MCSS17_016]WIE81282.1 hypothetical protein DEJ19_018790 [Curtobacterium sp. MCSS17_016]